MINFPSIEGITQEFRKGKYQSPRFDTFKKKLGEIMATETNKYTPTPSEEKLLQVLANPEHIGRTVTELCSIADVSRDVYYDAFKKPEFVAYHDSLCKDLVKQSLTPVVNAFIKEAKKGSFQHGKVLLEMGELYTQKQEVKADVNAKVESTNVDLSSLSTEELKKLCNI